MTTRLEEMRAQRAAKPKPLGEVLLETGPKSRPTVYPAHYWPNGCLTVGFYQRPEEGRPVPYEAWHLPREYFLKGGEKPFPLARFQAMVAEAVKAYWESTEDMRRALDIFTFRLRPLRSEVVQLDSGVYLTRFHKRPSHA